ncbi:MAG: CHC2 zinc finger domain-containing protein [Clostridia bacterium]|nr:CHC2 zinc finger domain-containing protein [Clostridia bacterium]
MIQIELKVGGNELAKVLHFYGLLESNDNEFKIVCPFHEDINASMKINLNDGSFYCFGCAKSGDAMKFVALVNSEMDELKACIEYFKILKSKEVKQIQVQRKAKVKQDNKQALIEAEDYYVGLKTIDWNKEQSPEKGYMLKRGFTANTLNKCKAKLTYNNAYPIVFPMKDLGRFRGWVCRTTNKKIEEKRKYLYNEGFSRRNTLVGDYDAKVVVLVEGYMDRLKFKQFGAKKVAAILGWKITEQQISKLKEQGVEYIVSALDNDTCGKKGTEYLKKFFKVIRFQYPSEVKDPGEMDQRSFDVANQKTKNLYREAINNEFSRRDKKASGQVRSK